MAMDKRLETILSGIEELIPEKEGHERLQTGKPLTIKFGADPTAADLHLGHMVVLNKLRQFQDLGHKVQFLIGNFTAMIGDPTGKSETRPPLTADEVMRNATTYQTQVFKILDPEKTEVVFNADWLSKLTMTHAIQLASRYTVARMLERDDFSKRFSGNQAISIHELLYPLLQGYDSVVLKSEMEIGGTDQKFNLLMGRHLQKEEGQTPQLILTVPILEGLDGVQKMSKSLGNHVGIMDAPNDMFGKLMSIPDPLIVRYYRLLTDKSKAEIDTIESALASSSINPKHEKERLAICIITRLHSEPEALAAQEAFNRVFSQNEIPEDIPDLNLISTEIRWDALLVEQAILPSKKEAVRMIEQGGVKLNDEKVASAFDTYVPNAGDILRVGKRKFFKIVISAFPG